jgi:DNA-binding CsgD family transcriptional regulator
MLNELNPNTQLKPGQIKKMSHRAYQALHYKIAGRSNNEIAELLNITPSRVSIILNSPVCKEEEILLRAQIEQSFVEATKENQKKDPVRVFLSQKALSLVIHLEELSRFADKEDTQRKAIMDLLSLTEYAKPAVNVGAVNVTVTPEQSDRLAKALEALPDNPTSLEDIGEFLDEHLRAESK